MDNEKPSNKEKPRKREKADSSGAEKDHTSGQQDQARKERLNDMQYDAELDDDEPSTRPTMEGGLPRKLGIERTPIDPDDVD